MQVADVMHTDVKTADAEDTFADVAKTMRTNGISSVVVLDGKKLAGIVTERDIVNLVAAGGDPHSVKVAHGMTRRDLETVGPKMDLADAAEHMVARNIRHLPVVDRGRVVGIVSIRDLTRWAAEELASGARDARHRAQPQGAAGRERVAEAAAQRRVGPGPEGTPTTHVPGTRSDDLARASVFRRSEVAPLQRTRCFCRVVLRVRSNSSGER